MDVRLTPRKRLRNAGLALAAIGLLASAPDPDAAIRSAHAQDVRLATVGYRLARGCAGLDVASASRVTTGGMLIQDIAQYGPADRDAARRVMRLGDGPTVVAVVPGSAAAKAGVTPGDVLIGVNGTKLDGDGQRTSYARMARVDRALAAGRATMTLDVRHEGTDATVGLRAEPGCASIFQLVAGRLQRTASDGTYVQISQAMFDLAESDDALAAIAAHELAHNALRHAALKTPSKRAETEADRLSVWLVARAGYDLDALVPFWERARKRSDYGIFADGSHPAWKDRLADLAASVATAKAQKAAGLPLVPPPQEGASQPPKPR